MGGTFGAPSSSQPLLLGTPSRWSSAAADHPADPPAAGLSLQHAGTSGSARLVRSAGWSRSPEQPLDGRPVGTRAASEPLRCRPRTEPGGRPYPSPESGGVLDNSAASWFTARRLARSYSSSHSFQSESHAHTTFGSRPAMPVRIRTRRQRASTRTGHPLRRDAFRQLRRGDRLADRHSRVWMVYAEPHEADGISHVVIRSGDLVRRVSESWADDYRLLPDDARQRDSRAATAPVRP